MQLIIDRFEGEFAVCERVGSTEMLDIARHLLPAQARAGTVIDEEDGRYSVNEEATAARSARIRRLLDSLWE